MAKKSDLLIHVCCAACFLRFEKSGGEKGDLFFYNPNIYPRTEYDARREAVRQVAQERGLEFIIPDYQPSDYFTAQKELWKKGKIDNKSLRCPNCFYLRLKKTMEWAAAHEYKRVSTTMLASEYLERELIERIGGELAKEFGLEWVSVEKKDLRDFHPKGFYQQNFCGCLFSLWEKSREKYLSEIEMNKSPRQ